MCRFSHFYAYWQQIVNHDSCPHSHVAFTLQFVREIRIDVSLPLSLCIVVTCLPQACMCVCVKRKRKCCLLAVQLMNSRRRRVVGGGGRGGFGLSTIRSGMQWRPLNCALNPYDGAIDVVTWWRCGTCLDYITMYVCPKGGKESGKREKGRQQNMLLAVTILLRFSCFATVLDGNSRECLTFSFIAQSFAIIFYLLAALPLLLLLLLLLLGMSTPCRLPCAVWTALVCLPRFFIAWSSCRKIANGK